MLLLASNLPIRLGIPLPAMPRLTRKPCNWVSALSGAGLPVRLGGAPVL